MTFLRKYPISYGDLRKLIARRYAYDVTMTKLPVISDLSRRITDITDFPWETTPLLNLSVAHGCRSCAHGGKF
jgi:hypothetical protein